MSQFINCLSQDLNLKYIPGLVNLLQIRRKKLILLLKLYIVKQQFLIYF